jgi:hypothetical protein
VVVCGTEFGAGKARLLEKHLRIRLDQSQVKQRRSSLWTWSATSVPAGPRRIELELSSKDIADHVTTTTNKFDSSRQPSPLQSTDVLPTPLPCAPPVACPAYSSLLHLPAHLRFFKCAPTSPKVNRRLDLRPGLQALSPRTAPTSSYHGHPKVQDCRRGRHKYTVQHPAP